MDTPVSNERLNIEIAYTGRDPTNRDQTINKTHYQNEVRDLTSKLSTKIVNLGNETIVLTHRRKHCEAGNCSWKLLHSVLSREWMTNKVWSGRNSVTVSRLILLQPCGADGPRNSSECSPPKTRDSNAQKNLIRPTLQPVGQSFKRDEQELFCIPEHQNARFVSDVCHANR